MNLNAEITQIEYNVAQLSYRLFIHVAGSTTKIIISHDTALELLGSFETSTKYKVTPNTQDNLIYYEISLK